MKKNYHYWFVLEPYTFVFKGENGILLYNSLSNETIHLFKKETIDLVSKFLDITNLYVVRLNHETLSSPEVKSLIVRIRDGFFGDILPLEEFPNKPVIIPPIAKIRNSRENIIKDSELQNKFVYSGFIHEIVFYINGSCNQNCQFCNSYLNQFITCNKSDTEIKIRDIEDKIILFSEFNITDFYITGGNIFLHPNFNDIVELFNEYDFSKKYYLNYLNYCSESANIVCKNEKNSLIIQISPPIKLEIIKGIHTNNNVIFEFIVQSELDLELAYKAITNYKIQNYTFKPFYYNNLDFFEKHIYTSEKDLYGSNNSKNDILIKGVINQFNYGRLIYYNKKVYTNINSPSIGEFDDDIYSLVKKEIFENSSWFITRNDIMPCKGCKYRYLCPSQSNYELVTGKNNLCSIF